MLKKFRRGSTYYKRRYTGNKEACKIEIRNFLSDHGLLKPQQRLRDEWAAQPWPLSKKLEQKLVLHMQDRLFLLLPKSYTQQFPRPWELIECVGYVDTPLVLQANEQNEYELRNNKSLYRKSPNPLVYLFNFIMHNITSKVYEAQHAKSFQAVQASTY